MESRWVKEENNKQASLVSFETGTIVDDFGKDIRTEYSDYIDISVSNIIVLGRINIDMAYEQYTEDKIVSEIEAVGRDLSNLFIFEIISSSSEGKSTGIN